MESDITEGKRTLEHNDALPSKRIRHAEERGASGSKHDHIVEAEQPHRGYIGDRVKDNDDDDDDGDDDDDNSMDSDYDNTKVEAEAAPLNLRRYQLELAENAVLGINTIICAETGSGKTWVALHIAKKHLEQAGNVPRKVIFMARTGALIKQQSDRFKAYLPQFQTRLITKEGEESRMLKMFLENNDILCFTPQILVNNLEDNVIKSLTEFSLLILDECHHTRGEGPYSTLMRKYLVEKSKTKMKMPQIVGLTASIGVGKSRTDQEAVDYILRVCACLDVRLISTVERNFKELKKHVNVPDEETIQLVKQKDDPCKHLILTAMEETEDKLQENSLMQPDMIDLMDKQPRDRESQEYNKWTVDVIKTALLKVDDYDVSRDISSCAKYLNIYNSALEVNKLLLSRDVIKYLAEKCRIESENKDKLTQTEKDLFSNLQSVQKAIYVQGKNTENPNVRILSDTLRKMLEEKGEDSRAMVFVKARATCRSLAAFLDEDLQNSGVNARPLYGKENRGGDDGMTESQQTEILEKFRNGYYKVLACTSVGNEGIDVPDCNIVLSYEYSGDEITKIQMKGRARKKKATTITFGSDKVVEQEMINTYKAAMMYRAMNIVKHLDQKFINMKVNAFQSEETDKYRFKAEVEKLKKGRKSDEDYEILCGRCNTFACYVSDVRQLGHDHIVIDKYFADKITRKPHNRPKTYDGIHKKYKMCCKKCPLDWGIIGVRDGLDYMILKIINFKFRNLRTHSVSNYKKWIDVPYNVPAIKPEDLPKLSEESLPEEVLSMDDESINLYKEALETGTTHANSIRVMVVGHSGVGKTTLTKRLFGEAVDVSQYIERTNSIDVHVRKCNVKLESEDWISLSKGESDQNYNKRIASILVNCSKNKELRSNEEHSQSREKDALTTRMPSDHTIDVQKSVKEKKKEVDEVLYERKSGRSEKKLNIANDFQTDADSKRLQILKLIENVLIDSMKDKNFVKETADLSVWDFAGQHVFYGTHQVFLSKRAVYLLVIDLSKHVDSLVEDECFIGCDGKARHNISEFVTFWLNSIHTYCRSKNSCEPPVILVGTFADKLAKEKRQELADEIFSEIRAKLTENKELYDHLTSLDLAIDNSINDQNIELLKKNIVNISKKQSDWNYLYPVRWIFLEKSLIELREQGLRILERRTLIEINKKNPLLPLSFKELDLFLRFHHQTGLILYFSEDSLKDYIVLKPQWLVDSLKCLITARQLCQSKRRIYKMWLEFYETAILKTELIDDVWKSETEFYHHKGVLLRFMEKLDLIAKPRHIVNTKCEQFYVAPCMLKEKVPDDVLKFCEGNCKSTSKLCFSTTTKIMPIQVYYSLIAECIMKWPINKHNGKLQMYCGCSIFEVDANHLLYVCFTDNTVQIWITKFSLSGSEPDVDVCMDVKSFIQCHLGNTLQDSCKVEMFVKCPMALPKQSGHWWRVKEMKKEIRCDDHEYRIVLSKAELMKYWDSMCLDQEEILPLSFMSKVPTEKQRNRMAQLIGKEYRSLAFQLGLSEVDLDHIDMTERLQTVPDKITTMLNIWVKNKSSEATFEELKNAMECAKKDWRSIFSVIANAVSDA